MTKSSTAIGNAAELKVKKFLEREGWLVCRTWRKYVWIKGKTICTQADFFNAFDIIALKPDDKILFAAVTVRRDLNRPRKKLNNMQHFMNQDAASFQIWQVKGKKARVITWPRKDLKDSIEIEL